MSNQTTFADTVETINATASNNADRLKHTFADLSGGMAQASAGVEQMQAKLVKTTETAMSTAAELLGGNLEALTRSSQIWAAGVQALSKQVAASVQSSVQETTVAFKTLATAKSVREAIELQSGFARTALDRAMTESSQLARASLKLTEQALAPVTERVRVTGQTFAKAV